MLYRYFLSPYTGDLILQTCLCWFEHTGWIPASVLLKNSFGCGSSWDLNWAYWIINLSFVEHRKKVKDIIGMGSIILSGKMQCSIQHKDIASRHTSVSWAFLYCTLLRHDVSVFSAFEHGSLKEAEDKVFVSRQRKLLPEFWVHIIRTLLLSWS